MGSQLKSKVKMAAPARQALTKAVDKNSLMYKFKKWCYYKSYYPELGLRTDDTWLIAGHYKPIIQEALRRLPKEELDARNFRMARANQLVLQKSVLPKEITYLGRVEIAESTGLICDIYFSDRILYGIF